MSTEVDQRVWFLFVETVKKMSTEVDYITPKLFLHVETVSVMSTEVDQRVWFIFVETVMKISTKVDSLKLIQYRYVETVMRTSTNSR